jgi:hypothetical protein
VFPWHKQLCKYTTLLCCGNIDLLVIYRTVLEDKLICIDPDRLKKYTNAQSSTSVCMVVLQPLLYQFCHWCVLCMTVCTHFVLCGGGVVYDVVIAGIAQPNSWDEASISSDRDKKESGASSHPTSASHSPTPPPQRRLAKSFSVAPSAVTKGNYGFLLLASVQLLSCTTFC